MKKGAHFQKGAFYFMRKRLLALLLSSALLFTGAAYISVPAEASESSTSSDDELQTGDFHIEAKKLADTSDNSSLKSKKSRVWASSSSAESSYWNRFSGHVYYDQLSSEEKQFYDRLKSLADSYLNSTASITSTRFQDGSSSYVTESVTQSGIGLNEALNIATIFLYENPQYYFIDSSTLPYTEGYSLPWWYDSDDSSDWTMSFKIYPAYANGQTRKSDTDQLKSIVDSYISGAQAYSTDLAKETYFHDQLASTVSYNTASAANQQSEDIAESQSASSAFFKKSTVCAGFTKAFSLLLNSQGIENVGVTSNSHAWNEVRINGTWYICDLTWDQNEWPTHKYFNISESEMRSKDQNVSYDAVGWWSFGSSGSEWAHTPLSYYSTLRPTCYTAHSSAVDAVDLKASAQQGSEGSTDTGNSSSDNTGTSGKSSETNATNITPEPQEMETVKPVKPYSFTVKRVKRGTLKLTIKTRKKVSGYYVLYRVKGSDAWNSILVKVNGKSKTFRISGLSKGRTYQLKAYSVDSKGTQSNATKVRTVKA